MKEIKRIMRDKMDLEMLEYVNSNQYLTEQHKINTLIEDLRRGLSNEKVSILNELLDEINNSDSQFSYEAFFVGVINGIFVAKS